ncbi:MAG: hypothetical protein DRI57_22595 [Deltaproteobacteria bacterium]|nr:MAG: hypothetical protein DRI57_22595 [Deltaproteobacteria bacterium]
MSCNKYRDHLIVLPEDDANRQIAIGFTLCSVLNDRTIQILPPSGGLRKVLNAFKNDHIQKMYDHAGRRLLLLIDFDNDKSRLESVKSEIPSDLKNRVFILGTQTEPEGLKKSVEHIHSFEDIGKELAKDCVDKAADSLWEHDLLKINNKEQARMVEFVKPFLFDLD